VTLIFDTSNSTFASPVDLGRVDLLRLFKPDSFRVNFVFMRDITLDLVVFFLRPVREMVVSTNGTNFFQTVKKFDFSIGNRPVSESVFKLLSSSIALTVLKSPSKESVCLVIRVRDGSSSASK